MQLTHELESAWFPVISYQVISWFQSLPFELNLHRYIVVPITYVGETRTATDEDKREIRDATTHLANAYAVVGNSDAIRALMQRLSTVDVPSDQFLFNALLRSEAADRSLGVVNYVELDTGLDTGVQRGSGGGGGGGGAGGGEYSGGAVQVTS
jgi:uncharacterized membrane protein YgcG